MVIPMAQTAPTPHDSPLPQKVVIVNGHPAMLDQLDRQLDAGRYDMVFVESTERAYTQIRKVLPQLIVLCANEYDFDTCQLMTMLKLDIDTCAIPVLSWPAETDAGDPDFELPPQVDEDYEVFPHRPVPAMN